jgi:hypothetical protein
MPSHTFSPTSLRWCSSLQHCAMYLFKRWKKSLPRIRKDMVQGYECEEEELGSYVGMALGFT